MYDKSPYTHRLRTVSWGNDNHPTGVFKPINGIPNLPSHHNSCVIEAQTCIYVYSTMQGEYISKE